ncbi:hypothetical protein [Streptosporangium subroseum]|uniref:hypothetical protein n=1 Tax=Streptosporangium subroseum TaxID=106412 RepID=UPI00308D480D|nr:hypothetical protein OHB15_08080 [Streptosporangium subroseum]
MSEVEEFDGGHVSGLGRWAVPRSSTVVVSVTREVRGVEEFDHGHVSDLGR